eukprot:gene8214-39_t
MGDEVMIDEISTKDNKGVIQINKNHFNDNRKKLTLLIKAYYHQLVKGCVLTHCTNKYCHTNQETIQPNEAAKLALELAKKSIVKEEYYFCDCQNPCIPSKLDSGATCVQYEYIFGEFEISKKKNDFKTFLSEIELIFSNNDGLGRCFLTKTGLRNFSNLPENEHSIDLDSLNQFYQEIEKIKDDNLMNEFKKILESKAEKLSKSSSKFTTVDQIRQFIILLEFPGFMEPSYHPILADLTKSILNLPNKLKDNMKTWLANLDSDRFLRLINVFHQYITIQLYYIGYIDEKIAYATRIIGLLNKANDIREKPKKIKFDKFYNDAVNNIVDLEQDYERWVKSREEKLVGFKNFAFCNYAFILDANSKSKILEIDANFQQSESLRQAFFSIALFQVPTSLYLVLKVKRDNLVETTLNELVMKTNDFKKPLRVKFIGEEGVDEGGVRKEFFQLLIKELVDTKYGMFTRNDETHTFWFNPHAYESSNNFRLVGIILGLAIYNSVILDLHFPSVVYKKLLGKTPKFSDLEDFDPSLAKGLKQLLKYDGDVEGTFLRTFQIETENYGEKIKVDLKKDGGNIPVTKENRQEYVDLLVQYLLVDSIEKQFSPFKQGFDSVCSGRPLELFRYEELELLVLGSSELDFEALEKVTRYVQGYSPDDEYIKAFWDIIKNLSLEEKKKFLQFTTGSDRAPIKGLGSMEFFILKNGDDTDRLPTSHTCFNHLLLPKYSSKDKLKKMILTAINNAEGFGLM